jgi:tetratricopeptide (TPR) repeat protein
MAQRSTTASGAPALVEQVRLFRNRPDVRWQYRVHEQILPALRRTGAALRRTDVVIEHAGYDDPRLRGCKLERNLRLLRLEQAEHPDDPFVLFNLGAACRELGRTAEALSWWQRGLALAPPGDGLVPRLYARLAEGQRSLGRRAGASATCAAGRVACPDDGELRLTEALLQCDAGALDQAEAGLRALAADGAAGPEVRQPLALVWLEQGRVAEAEGAWRALLAEWPAYLPGWLGLGELLLRTGRWGELEEVAARLGDRVEAAVLRARGQLARQEFAAARQTLEEVIGRAPEAPAPRVLLTHVLLQEGQDGAAAERALRAVVERWPGEVESWRNLAVLLQRQGRYEEAAATCREARGLHPDDADLCLLYGLLLRQT